MTKLSELPGLIRDMPDTEETRKFIRGHINKFAYENGLTFESEVDLSLLFYKLLESRNE